MKGKTFQAMANRVFNDIREIKQFPKNAEFNVVGVLLRITRRRDRNENPFWEMTIGDASGDMEGKAWYNASWFNNQGGDKFPIDPDNCGFTLDGLTIGINGTIVDYKGQPQYTFNEIHILDQVKYPPQKYTRRSPLKQEFLESTFKNLIAEISYKPLQDFINAVFFKHNLWEKYKVWPAAISIHHAYAAGLLEHSISVAIGARDMAKHYDEFLIPVNKDILIAGALLHDIGKIMAYNNIPVPQPRPEGSVIEHVSLGYGMFIKFAAAENLDEDLQTAIAHVILSHHGRFEYGSPVLPETPEAMLVSAADEIDFQLNYWKTQIEGLGEQNQVTEYLPMLERRLWKGIPPK